MNRFWKTFSLVVCFVGLVGGSVGVGWGSDEIDLPQPTGYVNDFADIIDNDDELNQKLTAFEQETTIEIAVVTVESLQDRHIDDFAARLFEQEGWQVGKEDTDNGVMFVIAPEERQVRIEVGYGLQGTLTDGLCGMIIENDVKPYFRKSQYSEGINSGVDKIIQTLQGNPPDYSSSGTTTSDEFITTLLSSLCCFGIGIPVLLLMFMQNLLKKSKGYWLGGVIGGAFGLVLSFAFWSQLNIWAIMLFPLAIITGTFTDWLADQPQSKSNRPKRWWTPIIWGGTGSGGGSSWGSGSSGGSFGGFSGGSSGGGGASSGW